MGGNWEHRTSGGDKGRACLFLFVLLLFRIWGGCLLLSLCSGWLFCLLDIGLKKLLGFPVRAPNSAKECFSQGFFGTIENELIWGFGFFVVVVDWFFFCLLFFLILTEEKQNINILHMTAFCKMLRQIF